FARRVLGEVLRPGVAVEPALARGAAARLAEVSTRGGWAGRGASTGGGMARRGARVLLARELAAGALRHARAAGRGPARRGARRRRNAGAAKRRSGVAPAGGAAR